MPATLLPASAAAFAPRAAPTVVLQKKVQPWLTQALKRTVTKPRKRPLNNATQQTKYLTELLAGPKAIWTLCSLMLPKAPESQLKKDDNPLVEALFNYQIVHIEAYAVHVDMVSQNEVAFKLTKNSIDLLVEHHKKVFSIDTSAKTHKWSEKDTQLKKLQEDFVQAINKFVHRADIHALEGLEEEGAGELLNGGASKVKSSIMDLFLPLLPPPKREPAPVRPAQILKSSTGPENWWPSSLATNIATSNVDSWNVLTPSPSMTSTTLDSASTSWPNSTMSELRLPSPSPTSSAPQSVIGGQLFAEPELYNDYSDLYTDMSPTSIADPELFSSCVPVGYDCFGDMSHYGNITGYTGPMSIASYPWDRYTELSMPFSAAAAM